MTDCSLPPEVIERTRYSAQSKPRLPSTLEIFPISVVVNPPPLTLRVDLTDRDIGLSGLADIESDDAEGIRIVVVEMRKYSIANVCLIVHQ
jgi:type II restriction/modification system DNA methylase subunit YeeA